VDDAPLYEVLFVLEHNLCKEYPALTPFEVEKRRFYDVIKLYAELRNMQIKEEKRNDPDRVIRRPAGDKWF